MGNLLFVPEGEIGPQAFIKGAVILLAANFALWMTWHLSLALGMFASFTVFVLIYCWFCLFIKRFRYAGKSGWLSLLTFLLFLILSYFVASLLAGWLVDPEFAREALEFQENMDPDNPDIEETLAFLDRLIRVMVLPWAAGFLIAGGIIAFGTNKLLANEQP